MWMGALVSNIGTWMETVALAYYVADTTGKASWSAVVAAAGFIPAAIVGPVGSAMADRLDRRRVLITTNALSALMAAILAVWVANGNAGPGGIAALSFIAGAVAMFGFPSFQTALPDLVPREHLVAAVGLSNAQWNLGRILGPTLRGTGDDDRRDYHRAVVQRRQLRCGDSRRRGRQPPRPSKESGRPIFRALADGAEFARHHPAMRRMLALMIATILIASPFIAFVSQMATNVFDGSEEATSLLVTAQGIGAVTAAFTLGGLTERLGVWRLLTGAVLLLGPALVLYAIAPALWVAAIGLAIVGLLYGYAFTSFAGVAQQSAPNEMRGRVLAVNSFVLGLLYPIGTLIQGALTDTAGLRWVTAASGLTLLAVTVVLTFPHLRRLQAEQPTERPAPATPAARVLRPCRVPLGFSV